MPIFNPNQPALGLDVSDFVLRLVQLKKKKNKIILISHNEIAVPPGLIKKGEIKNADKIALLMKELVNQTRPKIKTSFIISSLPEPKTFIKLVSMRLPAEKREWPKIIKSEAFRHFPLQEEKASVDWQIIRHLDDETKILLAAAPKDIAETYLETFEKAKLVTRALEVEAAAISRALIKEGDLNPYLILDLGATRSSIAICDQGVIQFTLSVKLSGRDLTKLIKDSLDLTPRESELAKITCGLAEEKCDGIIKKILLSKPGLFSLAQKIKEVIGFYQKSFPGGRAPKQIIICGGGANLDKLDKYLQGAIRIPAIKANPFKTMAFSPYVKPLAEEKFVSYATAVGLALRGLEPETLL